MIKILRSSNCKSYRLECARCKCLFSFIKSDIDMNNERCGKDWTLRCYISCPECGGKHYLGHEEDLQDYESKNDWISVNEQLPEAYKSVLLLKQIGLVSKIFVGYYNGKNFKYAIDDLWQYDIHKELITHWRLLPDTPY